MSAAAASTRRGTLLIGAVVAASLVAWIATESPALALAPAALVVAAWAFAAAPPHRTALVVFFLAIVADNPKEHPAEGLWSSPLEPLGVYLYENLNNVTGVSALRFCGADLLIAALFAATLLRRPARDAIRVPHVVERCLAAAWLVVLWIELWGMARGGDFKASLWQVRAIFWAPAIAYVFARSIRGPRDHRAIGAVIVAAAVIKATFGVYYYELVALPTGHRPSYATTHSDTILFVAAAVIAVVMWMERPSLRGVAASLAVLSVVGAGIVVNGRRLAYVSLVGTCAAVLLLIPPGRRRRNAVRALLSAGPLTAAYLAAGWTAGSAFFGPARKVASLFSKEDRSAAMRDIENYNLVFTWRKDLLLGSGFGHEYTELTTPEGIRGVFSLYRYIGHNSVLWLAAAGGIVGLAVFWTLPALVAYFGARSYPFAVAPIDRAAALASVSVPVMFGVQAYGDMGLQSWTAMFFLGMSLAVSSKLAVASGAFPGHALAGAGGT